VFRIYEIADWGRLMPLNAEASRRISENSPTKLRRRLKGDLDNIVLKALRKEPERRYASVEQLAEDIRRHLEGLPVAAAPDSLLYRSNKFVRRHKVGMTAAALIVIAVLGGVVTTVHEARIAAANQRRAEKRFNDVRKLANSLMFEIHDSIEGLPGATSARNLIVQRSQEYLDSLAQEAGGDISLQRDLASAYERLGTVQGDMYGTNLGDATGALQSFQKSLAIRQAIVNSKPHGSDDQIALARAYQEVGRVQWLPLGQTKAAIQNLQKAVDIAESAGRGDPGNVKLIEVLARGYLTLGDVEGGSGLRGSTANLHDALQNHRKALPLLRRMADAAPSDPGKKYLVARATVAVGDDYVRAGDPSQALNQYQQAAAILKPVAENVNNALYRRGFAICHTRMGDALLMLGRPVEALALYRQELQLLKPLAVADPKDNVVSLDLVTAEGDIGHALVETGKVAEGKAMLLNVLAKAAAQAKNTGDSYARTLLASVETLTGEAFESEGAASSAQQHYLQALDLYSVIVSADPADTEDAVNVAIVHNHLGATHLKSGDTGKAAEDYRKALDDVQALALANPDNVEVLYALADAYAGLGEVAVDRIRSTDDHNEKSIRWREGQGWYAKSLNAWQKIPHPSPISPNGFRAGDPRDVERRAKATLVLAQTHITQ
jgi:eukaryotic-like serine/threonine-protein kinase